MSKQHIPALPSNAIGFVAVRADRPERLALFRADGTLSNSFAQDDTMETVAAVLASKGLCLIEGGAVVR
jgi:hypothetical protein